jgi:hypothetical protein
MFVNGGQLITRLIRRNRHKTGTKQAQNLIRLILVGTINENLFNNITTHNGT